MVSETNDICSAKYGVFALDTDVPPSFTVKYVNVNEKTRICLMHFKSPSSKYHLGLFST